MGFSYALFTVNVSVLLFVPFLGQSERPVVTSGGKGSSGAASEWDRDRELRAESRFK